MTTDVQQRTFVPPIKCQGIKTKLIPFIRDAVRWDESLGGKWIEPFLGSGVVLFNIQPQRALVADNNKHIIAFYQSIQNGDLSGDKARAHLESNGALLRESEGSHYYEVRERFNEEHNPLDFLFLSRSCFNGVMRFNKKGGFNVPFCKKPERFSKAYVSKIVNQVNNIAAIMEGKDWEFRHSDFRMVLTETQPNDFIYLDPPYIGRHVGYMTDWTQRDAEDLAIAAQASSAGFALSMWKMNRHRTNDHLDSHWGGNESVDFEHFYHVGPSESLRNSMTETLIIKPGNLNAPKN